MLSVIEITQFTASPTQPASNGRAIQMAPKKGIIAPNASFGTQNKNHISAKKALGAKALMRTNAQLHLYSESLAPYLEVISRETVALNGDAASVDGHSLRFSTHP